MSSTISKLLRTPLSITLFGLSLCAQSSDLAEIYALAVKNDHEFKAATAAYLADSEQKNLSRSGLLPSINGEASWSDTESESRGESINPSQFFGTIDNTTTGYSVSLVQPLFDLSAWNSFKSGDAIADAAEATYASTKQALIIRSAQAYFDVLLAASNLETSLAQEDALLHQLQQTEQRYEVGLSAITEVHEARAAYDSSVPERLLAEGQLGITFEGIEVLTGQSFDSLRSLKQEFTATAPEPSARESWVERALENNYALQAAKLSAKALDYSAKSAKSQHLPTLSLRGTYANEDNDTSIGSTQLSDTDTDTKSISLNLTIPLYNGGSVSSQRRQAKQQAVQARENYLKLRRDIVQSARSQHLNVLTGVSTVKARAQAIVSRESALEATQAGYRVGTRDLVDVLNAQQSLYQAKRDYNTAVFDYIISSLNLKEVAGQLSEEDIGTLNTWLDVNNMVNRYMK